MIDIEGNKTLKFYPNMLTKKKAKAIDSLAVKILQVKNMLALHIASNIDYFIENITSKYDFFTYCSKNLKDLINLPSQVYTETLEDVYDAHLNRFKTMRKELLGVTLACVKKVEYYKIDRPKDFIFKDGVKSITYSRRKTDLTIFLGTMSMFYEKDGHSIRQQMTDYTDRNLESLRNEYNELSNKKYEGIYNIVEEIKKDKKRLIVLEKSIKHFENFSRYLSDEMIFNRIYVLSRSRRERIISYYRTNPIIFKSKSFRGRSKVKKFIQENDNSNEDFKNKKHHSVINSFMDFGAVCSEYSYESHLYVPVKHSKSYHGSIDSFLKTYESDTSRNYQYHVVYDTDKDFHITTSKKCVWSYPEITDDMETFGSDLNMKHNMEQLSDGSYIDWPRKLIDELVKVEIRKDGFKSQIDKINKEVEIKKKKESDYDSRNEELKLKDLNNSVNIETRKEKKLITSIEYDVFRKISKMLKHIKSESASGAHLALEDIDGKFKSNKKLKYKTQDGYEINLNRILKLCHFGEIKDIIKRMASKEKYGIPVSFVPSYYSSQICPYCGYIEKKNRKTQEELKCVNCGRDYPADLKAARVLATYLCSAVLRNSLLTQDNTGAYVPKKRINKENTKQILEKYSRDIVETFREKFQDK